jgi:hypothetical protein
MDWLKVSKGLILGVDVNSTDAAAISVLTPVTILTAAGAESRTLPNAKDGQIKILVAKTITGTITITPTNLYNGTTITMDHVNDTWVGVYYGGDWHTLVAGSLGATIA